MRISGSLPSNMRALDIRTIDKVEFSCLEETHGDEKYTNLSAVDLEPCDMLQQAQLSDETVFVSPQHCTR